MYPNISMDQIDPQSSNAVEKINEFYQVQIDKLSFVLDQACELIESELPPNEESNTAIALGMMTQLGKRMEGLMLGC